MFKWFKYEIIGKIIKAPKAMIFSLIVFILLSPVISVYFFKYNTNLHLKLMVLYNAIAINALISMLYTEDRDKLLQYYLTKPISRTTFVIRKIISATAFSSIFILSNIILCVLLNIISPNSINILGDIQIVKYSLITLAVGNIIIMLRIYSALIYVIFLTVLYFSMSYIVSPGSFYNYIKFEYFIHLMWFVPIIFVISLHSFKRRDIV